MIRTASPKEWSIAIGFWNKDHEFIHKSYTVTASSKRYAVAMAKAKAKAEKNAKGW